MILLEHNLRVLCMSEKAKKPLDYQLPVLHTVSPSLDAEAEAKLMKKLPLPTPIDSPARSNSFLGS